MEDSKKASFPTAALSGFFYGYRAFTAEPDKILSELGLSRVHHRVMFFLALEPESSISALLDRLQVSKQALHLPLKQLVAQGWVSTSTDDQDRRVRRLSLSAQGAELEQKLRKAQMEHLSKVFEIAGTEAVSGWMKVNALLAETEKHEP